MSKTHWGVEIIGLQLGRCGAYSRLAHVHHMPVSTARLSHAARCDLGIAFTQCLGS